MQNVKIENKIKNTWQNQVPTEYNPGRPEDAEQLELSYIAGGNTKWYSHSEKQKLPYDPAKPLLGICPRK